MYFARRYAQVNNFEVLLLENDLNVIDNEEGTCSCGKILDYS
jgi:hypothetical protein